jgi:hypothetical protein
LNGEIAWLSPWGSKFQHVALILECKTTPGSDSSGGVSYGFISIRGILKGLGDIELREHNDNGLDTIVLQKESAEGENRQIGCIYPDAADFLSEGHVGCGNTHESGLNLFVLPIRREHTGNHYMGLVLRYNHVNRRSYRRVGVFTWSDGSSCFDGCAEQIVKIE